MSGRADLHGSILTPRADLRENSAGRRRPTRAETQTSVGQRGPGPDAANRLTRSSRGPVGGDGIESTPPPGCGEPAARCGEGVLAAPGPTDGGPQPSGPPANRLARREGSPYADRRMPPLTARRVENSNSTRVATDPRRRNLGGDGKLTRDGRPVTLREHVIPRARAAYQTHSEADLARIRFSHGHSTASAM
jgi:hypothetical protein